MANATTTSLAYILKQQYKDGLAVIGYEASPFLAMVPKDTGFIGSSREVPLLYGAPTGRSVNFTSAKANKKPSNGKRFSVTLARDYALGGIDALALKTAVKDGSIGEGLKTEVEGLTYSLTRSISSKLFRNGGGAIGVVSAAGAAATTITLATPDDIVNFEVGMVIDGSINDGLSGVVIAGGVIAVVSAVDRNLGKITSTGGNWNAATGINGIAAAGFLFQQGDFGGAMVGLAGWLPATAPSATSFFGVDRSVDPTRLGGHRIAAKATIEATLLNAVAVVGREGGKVDTIIMHPLDLADLVEGLGSKCQYTNVKSSDVANIGFKAVSIIGTTGEVKIVGDLNCPRGIAYALQLDTWCLTSAGPLVHMVEDDGSKMLRDSDGDSVEIRMRSFPQLYCKAPGYNARIALPLSA
jgi:hypothetical protein